MLSRLDDLDGDRGALLREADQLGAIETTQKWQAGIESRLEAMAAPTVQNWQSEWAVTSQKILDAAAQNGTSMTVDEVNTVAFNNGIQFESKADAEAALTAALIAKAKGESIPVSVVSTEGGEVAQPPAPPAEPKPFRQQFDELQAAGKTTEARELLDSQWKVADDETRVADARRAAEEAGLTLAE
jgi:hypothetical protein